MQRIWLVVGMSFLGLCLFSGPGFAQDTKARVAVTVLGGANGLTGQQGRDRLVKVLNKQKKSSVEAVPIESTVGDQMSAEARQKNCEFLLFTTQAEAHAEGGATGKPGQTVNIPEYHAKVDYKLYRVSDSTVVASGSGVATDIGSQGDVVGMALDNLAKKVPAEVMKAAAAPAPK